MNNFWGGFEKRAAYRMRLGSKALNPSLKAGLSVGVKPRAGVTTAAAFKPNPIPTPGKAHPAANNTKAALPSVTAKSLSMPAHSGSGVSEMVI